LGVAGVSEVDFVVINDSSNGASPHILDFGVPYFDLLLIKLIKSIFQFLITPFQGCSQYLPYVLAFVAAGILPEKVVNKLIDFLLGVFSKLRAPVAIKYANCVSIDGFELPMGHTVFARVVRFILKSFYPFADAVFLKYGLPGGKNILLLLDLKAFFLASLRNLSLYFLFRLGWAAFSMVAGFICQDGFG